MPQHKGVLEIEYLQHPQLGFWFNPKGTPVQIFPPTNTRVEWILIRVEYRESYYFLGNECEERAFAMAASIINYPD